MVNGDEVHGVIGRPADDEHDGHDEDHGRDATQRPGAAPPMTAARRRRAPLTPTPAPVLTSSTTATSPVARHTTMTDRCRPGLLLLLLGRFLVRRHICHQHTSQLRELNYAAVPARYSKVRYSASVKTWLLVQFIACNALQLLHAIIVVCSLSSAASAMFLR